MLVKVGEWLKLTKEERLRAIEYAVWKTNKKKNSPHLERGRGFIPCQTKTHEEG